MSDIDRVELLSVVGLERGKHPHKPPGRDVIAYRKVSKSRETDAGSRKMAQSLTIACYYAAGRASDNSFPILLKGPRVCGTFISEAKAIMCVQVSDAARLSEALQIGRGRDDDHRRLAELARREAGVL